MPQAAGHSRANIYFLCRSESVIYGVRSCHVSRYMHRPSFQISIIDKQRPDSTSTFYIYSVMR